MRVGAIVVVRAVQVPSSLMRRMIAAAPDGIAITANIIVITSTTSITQISIVAARRGQEVAMAQVCGLGIILCCCFFFIIFHGPMEQTPSIMMGAVAMVIEPSGTPFVANNIITNITLTLVITIGIVGPRTDPLVNVDAAQPRIDAPGR